MESLQVLSQIRAQPSSEYANTIDVRRPILDTHYMGALPTFLINSMDPALQRSNVTIYGWKSKILEADP